MKQDVKDVNKDLDYGVELLQKKMNKFKKEFNEGILSFKEIKKIAPIEDTKKMKENLKKIRTSIKKIEKFLQSLKGLDKATKPTKKYGNPNISKYGRWEDSIRGIQDKHPSLGNIPLTWYQAKPDGGCFFISVDASINNKKNVHSTHGQGAKYLRHIIVNSMDKLLGKDQATAFEMFDSLPGELGEAPPIVTRELLNKYKKYMSSYNTWAGEIELKLMAEYLKRPIIIFYNNHNPATIIWHDKRHQENYNDNSQFRGGPVPIILGHVPPAGSGTGVHYIYALFNESGSLKKKKQTKRKKQTRRRIRTKRN